MSSDALVHFLSGAVTLGHALVALFFFRFWRKTRDGLFLAFAAAFVLLAIQRTLAALLEVVAEQGSVVDILRVAAFLVILAAIIAKNRR